MLSRKQFSETGTNFQPDTAEYIPTLGAFEAKEKLTVTSSKNATEIFAFRNDAANALELTSKEGLALQEMHFTLAAKGREVSVDELKTASKVIVPIHGWTGTSEIFFIKDVHGKTMVDHLLEQDPDAIIVIPDMVGFGQSPYNPELHGQALQNKCTVDSYAKQVNFLLTKVCGLAEEDKSKVEVIGHSFGGACALMLAANYGIEKVTAVCPALREKGTQKIAESDIPGLMYESLHQLLGLSNTFKKLAPEFAKPIMSNIVEYVFKYVLGGYLMGENKHGDMSEAEAKNLFKQLSEIHIRQITSRLELSATIMQNLAEGVSAEELNLSTIAANTNVRVIEGDSDLLGTGSGFERIFNQLGKAVQRFTTRDAGHYAPLFDLAKYTAKKH